MVELSEEEIDDILYFARANELQDLKDSLKELTTRYSSSEVEVCSAAIDGETKNNVLHYASANGHKEIVEYLFELFEATRLRENDTIANPSITPPGIINAQNKAGNTSLHWAALNGHVEIILLLLNHGADPSILNVAGHDALYEAEVNEREKAVEVLLAEGNQLEAAVGEGEEEGTVGGEEEEEIVEKMDHTSI